MKCQVLPMKFKLFDEQQSIIRIFLQLKLWFTDVFTHFIGKKSRFLHVTTESFIKG